PRVVILGAGPNRIGQGIEFDYACVHAAFALEEAGFASVMINSNPETVSTDYDTASRLYFEPLAAEDVLAVCRAERPVGVIAQLERFVGMAAEASPEHPVLIDRFLEGAIEVDVDAVCDATGDVFIGAVMEHIEEAGVHSGDSSCQIPPATLSDDELDTIEDIT